jgi:type VI secretion system secreted protein Hcp
MSDVLLMKVTDVKGQTQQAGYADHMELLSYSHGISQNVTTNVSNKDRTTGRPIHQDFNVTKEVDQATPSLLQGLNEGKVFKEVLIIVARSDGPKPLPIFTYTLEDAVISSMSVGGGGGKPTESISFNYSAIKWAYEVQKEEGKSGGKAVAEWDVSVNAEKAAA